MIKTTKCNWCYKKIQIYNSYWVISKCPNCKLHQRLPSYNGCLNCNHGVLTRLINRSRHKTRVTSLEHISLKE